MEVKETAACGISQREFAVEFDADEFAEMHKLLKYANDGTGEYDDDFLEDLQSQMSYIIGPTLDEDPPDDIAEEKKEWAVEIYRSIIPYFESLIEPDEGGRRGSLRCMTPRASLSRRNVRSLIPGA